MRLMTTAWIALAVVTAAAFFSAASAGPTKWCGGGGGDKTLKLQCATGQLMIGAGGWGNSFLDGVGILCGAQQSGNSFVPVGDWKRGPGNVLFEGSGICNGGRAVTQMATRADLFVDRLSQGTCSICNADKCFEFSAGFTVNAGGGNDNAGRRCNLVCPKDEGAYALEVRYGAWIDAIRLHCRKP